MVTHDTNTSQEHYTITGVAPGREYDPDIELLYDDITDAPTVKLAAISPVATVKMPVVRFDVEVGK